MTENYRLEAMQRAQSPPPGSTEGQGTADIVREQASGLSHSSVQAGKHVAEVAREQGAGVAAETARQGRDLLQQAQGQMVEQVAHGQQRTARQLLSLSDELRAMAENPGHDGMAADLAHQAASRLRDAGQWLEDRQPGQVMEEMQSFARRRPGVFVVLAAGAGLVAGRLTRGLKDAGSGDPAATAAPAAAQGLDEQWAQPSDVAGSPSATARPGAEIPGPSAPASDLPPAGGDPVWQGGPAYGEPDPMVTGDRAGHEGTL